MSEFEEDIYGSCIDKNQISPQKGIVFMVCTSSDL